MGETTINIIFLKIFYKSYVNKTLFKDVFPSYFRCFYLLKWFKETFSIKQIEITFKVIIKKEKEVLLNIFLKWDATIKLFKLAHIPAVIKKDI